MATYRYVAHNILQSYKKTEDDSDLLINQVLFWIQTVVNRLRKENESEFEMSRFLAVFCNIPVLIDKACHNRKYIDVPVDILDMKGERGVEYITYNFETGCCCSGANFAQVAFEHTRPSKSFRLMMDEYEKPTPKNPYFYRVAGIEGCDNVNRIYFLGLECVDVKDVEIGVICSQNPSSLCSLDDEIPLPAWLIEDLITRVLNLGRFLLIAPQENINQGSDLTSRFNQNTPVTQLPPLTEGQQAAQLKEQMKAQQNIQSQVDEQ